MNKNTKTPSMVDALVPITLLIIMLSLSVYLYGDNSSYGGNQIALILAASVGAIIGNKNGLKRE